MEKLSNVKAMIQFKFKTKTRSFFIAQQILFVGLCITPFVALQLIKGDSDWVITCLILSELGQVIFLVIEIANVVE